MNGIFYFGCRGGAGHHLFHPSGGMAYGFSVPVDFPCSESPDATFLPSKEHEVEGVASLCQVNGWTVLAFWDRSIDNRPGANSAFLVRGIMDFEAICAIAREAFPWVWQRFKFPVVERRPQ
jgi:hypothetical protein